MSSRAIASRRRRARSSCRRSMASSTAGCSPNGCSPIDCPRGCSCSCTSSSGPPIRGASELRAVVLLSGGLDSYTAAAIVKRDGFDLYALTIAYGQRHAREVEAARALARALGVERHLELPIDLRAIGGSSLTSDVPVPRDRDLGAAAAIPSTYVPAR